MDGWMDGRMGMHSPHSLAALQGGVPRTMEPAQVVGMVMFAKQGVSCELLFIMIPDASNVKGTKI
jgi:hypothetical protein